jgi:hypothetical protein
MIQRLRSILQVLVVVALLVADQLARLVGIERAADFLCLINLATLVICARLGWRQALLGVAGLVLLNIRRL